MRGFRSGLTIGLFLIFISSTVFAQLTPQQAITQIERGINIGNTLEPPDEGGWNNGPLQEYYFDDYKTEGFTCVRVPVRWDQHTSNSAPFTIDASWLNRVEQVVDWGLQRNLFIIINAHHEDWLKQNYSNPTYRARFDSIWSQVSRRFKDKSEKLFFEIINEPIGLTLGEINELNARIISIIRVTNPTRIIIFSGNEWSGANDLMNAAIPIDNFLMGYYHSYDPWDFAGLANGTWGTIQDVNAVKTQFQNVAQWSQQNNIPVMISEFGAVRNCDYNSRMYHYSTYVEEALTSGIAFQVWDDGGDFGIYERDSRTWNEVKDILVKTYPGGPTRLRAFTSGDSAALLIWQNRITTGNGIRIERKIAGGEFTEAAILGPTSTSYTDPNLSPGNTYYYRVVAVNSDLSELYSYPIRIYLPPVSRSSFHGFPFQIPGFIDAEDFDIGGEGLTYHDTEPSNIPGYYRPNEGVDIEPRSGGGYQISYVENGEWLEYTLNVSQSGTYNISAFTASQDGGGKIRFDINGASSNVLTIPKTNNWTTLAPVTTSMNLIAGEQILRVNIISIPKYNIDRIEFEYTGVSSVEESDVQSVLNVYPNPASGNINIAYNKPLENTKLNFFNILGELVKSVDLNQINLSVSLNDLSKGIYFLRMSSKNDVLITKKIIVF